MKNGPMLAPSESAHAIIDLCAAGATTILKFPMIAEIKFDGFRCIIPNGSPMTRALKPIRNNHVRRKLETVFGEYGAETGSLLDSPDHPLNGLDGELIALDPETLAEEDLHRTQSRINKADGAPRFVFHVFDDFTKPLWPYIDRIETVHNRVKRIREHVSAATLETNPERRSQRIHDHVFQAVPYRICERIEDVLEFEAEALAWGAEGIMLKDMQGHYKFGRATFKEGLIYKVKRFSEDEATIIGFVELMINENEAVTDERGYTKRSSAKENLVPGNTLGAIVCDWNGVEFELGTFKGWTDSDKQEIWDNRKNYICKKINFKYKGTGPNGKPLIPSAQGIRYDV